MYRESLTLTQQSVLFSPVETAVGGEPEWGVCLSGLQCTAWILLGINAAIMMFVLFLVMSCRC